METIKITSPIFNRLYHGGVLIFFLNQLLNFCLYNALIGFLSTSGILHITLGRKAC